MFFFFDWYGATPRGVTDPDLIASRVLIGLGPVVLRDGAGGLNYPYSMRGDLPAGGSLAIYYGNDKDVFVQATGGAAQHVADVLRRAWPDHTVARVDVACDFDEPGCFGRLWRAVDDERKGRAGKPIAAELAGDWLDAVNGRTFYAGGRSSAYRVRVYEKGHEQRSKHPDQTFSLDWTRVEAQVRPKGAGKRTAAQLAPEALFAWTPFGAAVLRAVARLKLEPQAPKRAEATDPEYWCARQYGVLMRRWLELPDHELRAVMMTALERAASSPSPSTSPEGAEHLPPAGLEPQRA